MFQNSAKVNLATYKSSFWGICCLGGKNYSQVVKQKFHISMAALDPAVTPTSPTVSVIVERRGIYHLLCTLKPGTVMQVNLDLFFDIGEEITFSVSGQGTVHLTGYIIHTEGDELNSSKDSSSQNIKKQMKSVSPTKKLFTSPAERKKAAKEESEKGKKVVTLVKVATPMKKTANTKMAESEESSSSEEEVSSSDEDAKRLQKISKKRPVASLEEEEDSDDSEDEDDSLDDDDDSEDDRFKKVIKPVSKKLKTNTSTPMQGKKPAEVIVVEDDDSSRKGSKKAESSKKLGVMNSSIGRTPMPKKSASSILQKTNSFNESKKKKMEEFDESSELDSDVDDSVVKESDMNKSVSQVIATPETPSSKKKKKKKKKKKAAGNESNLSENKSDLSKANGNNSNARNSKKLLNGVEYEDIRVGNGPVAVKGKLAHVYYTGKLEGDKVFDTCLRGTKPFSFKLGSGQVIKGWDIGVEGMKVGGKRRLKIPPQMAYKNQRSGQIPPNSTLYFDVELKAVS